MFELWSDEKRTKYSVLYNFVLSDDAQISPVEQRWEQVKSELPRSIYQRPKAQQRQFTAESAAGQSRGVVAGAIVKKVKGPSKVAKKACAAAAEAECDEGECEEGMVGYDAAPRGVASSSKTSGRTVTISEELFNEMAASHWGRGA